jgi:hypothetical protein
MRTQILENHIASLTARGRLTRATLHRTFDWFVRSLERTGLDHNEAVSRFWDAVRRGRALT